MKNHWSLHMGTCGRMGGGRTKPTFISFLAPKTTRSYTFSSVCGTLPKKANWPPPESVLDKRRLESHGPSAENKAVTGGTFMKFRRPQALRDKTESCNARCGEAWWPDCPRGPSGER